MNRLSHTRGAHLAVLLVASGCCAVLLVLWASTINEANANSMNSVDPIRLAAPHRENAYSPLPTSYSGIHCTVDFTTTADTVGGLIGNNFASAFRLGTSRLNNLSLVGTVNVPDTSNPVSAAVFDEYFYLAPQDITVGAFYTVTASNEVAGNYNLGIIIYNASQNEIQRDTSGGSSVIVTLVPTITQQYYFRVVHVVNPCYGGTYDLSYATSPPAPGTVPDQYEPNNTRDTAKRLTQNNVTGLSL